MTTPIIQVDAFTSEAFAGNPAAVCVLPGARDEQWMRHVAREMNLSETAFLHPHLDGYELRWFTPAVEVDLCGHATLATAHVLFETDRLKDSDTARFYTRSGLLTAVKRGDWIELDFPGTPEEAVEPPPGLIEALHAQAVYFGKNRFDYIVEVSSEEEVQKLAPDFTALGKVSARGVIVTSTSRRPGVDFVSRFFAPAAGVDEDPVTGSAHCCLAPFWSSRLNKTEFTARQLSARGGELKVRLAGDRVRLGGQAVTVLRGELLA